MKRVEKILAEFLRDLDRLEEVPLGGEERGREPTAEDTERLDDLLFNESRFNRVLLLTYIACLLTLYFIGIFFIFYFRDTPQTMAILFGGTFLGLAVVIKPLVCLWRERMLMDTLRTLIRGLSVDDAIRNAVREYIRAKLSEAMEEIEK